MKKVISTELNLTNITRILDLLADTPGKLERLSAGLSDDQLHQPLRAGERSFIEDLAHLINSEARISETIYLALLADEPYFLNIHSERQWGKLLRFDWFDFTDLLAYFKLRRKVLLRVLTALTPDRWSRTIREEGKQRKESIYWRARSLAMHELEHLIDLENKIARYDRSNAA
jgi:hypothetical protein